MSEDSNVDYVHDVIFLKLSEKPCEIKEKLVYRRSAILDPPLKLQ